MGFVAVDPRTGMCAEAAELFERLHDAHEEDVEADCERFFCVHFLQNQEIRDSSLTES